MTKRTLSILTCLTIAATALAQDPAVGKKLFEKSCAVCHGLAGDGKGPASYLLYPPPRDFTRGLYKFRSTPSGSAPMDADLTRTIRGGLPGTAMPAWRDFGDQDVAGIIAYLKSLAPDAFRTPPAPIAIGEPPKIDKAEIGKGKELYAKMGCAACHGEKGTGDGPSAKTLVDSQGLPIRPFDFTRGGSMKGGSTIKDIYRTFTTGVDGTPMPSFVEAVSDVDRWALAAYVQSLGAGNVPPPAAPGALTIAKVASVVQGPDDPAWRNVPETVVPLRPTHSLSFTVDRVSVKAMQDGKKVAFLLEWADPIPNQDTLTVDSFRDGAAIQFPMTPVAPGETIFFGMGEKNIATNIWHWKADWQSDVMKVADVASGHPNMAVDMYPDAASRTAADVGNLMPIAPRQSPIEDLNATGFSTLTSQPKEKQNVQGKGIYLDGKWRVAFVRTLASPDDTDAKVDAVDTVAFAIWNGAAGDRNGQKAVSEWVRYKIER